MTKRKALMLTATALVAAACSSSSRGGSGLPSIAAASPTATATGDAKAPTASAPTPTVTASGASPTAGPSGSASASASGSASADGSAAASGSASPSGGPAALGGGGCASSQLSLNLGAGQGAAGSQITPLVFTNTGATPCLLSGYPGVSFVTGDSGQQVGAAAERNGSAGTGVTLAPHGSAQALVRMANTDNYPMAQCTPVAVRGLRVYPPGQKAALFVALPDGSTACSTLSQGAGPHSQLSVQSVSAA